MPPMLAPPRLIFEAVMTAQREDMISELESSPTIAGLYGRAIINTALKGKQKPELPEIGVSLQGIKTSRKKIQKPPAS